MKPDVRKTTGFGTIKKLLTLMVATGVLLSSIVNITNQLVTIIRAKREIMRLESEVVRLEAEEKVLMEKVKISTNSAYLEGQVRDVLGMGTKEDYWVILPEVKQVEGVYPKMNEAKEATNLEKWIEMFTD